MEFLKDNLFSHLLKNVSVLFVGNVVASGIGLISLALTARALGANKFGILIMITTFVLIAGRLLNFQCGQTVIKYGADSLEKQRNSDFKTLVKFGFYIDILASVVGFFIAVLSILIFGYFKGWQSSTILVAVVYSVTLLSHITGTSTAILRLFDKFKFVAYSSFIAAIVKLSGVLVAYFLKADLAQFILAWGIADIIGSLSLVFFALVQLKAHCMIDFFKSELRDISNKFRGLWSVIWSTNLTDTVQILTNELDVLVVGAMLNPGSVAVYKIAKQVAIVPTQIANPIQQILFPALAKLWSDKDLESLNNYSKKVSVWMGGLGLIALVLAYIFGKWFILKLFGSAYYEAYTVLLYFMVAYSVYYFGLHLKPIALIIGLHRAMLFTYIISGCLFYSSFFFLIRIININGPAISSIIFNISWFVILKILITKELRKSI